MGINFLSKMRVVKFVSSMEKMNNLKTDLGRIFNLSILHLEMVKIEGLKSKLLENGLYICSP
jgi:hypothetical protein